MILVLRRLWDRLRTSYWFVPSLMILAATARRSVADPEDLRDVEACLQDALEPLNGSGD